VRVADDRHVVAVLDHVVVIPSHHLVLHSRALGVRILEHPGLQLIELFERAVLYAGAGICKLVAKPEWSAVPLLHDAAEYAEYPSPAGIVVAVEGVELVAMHEHELSAAYLAREGMRHVVEEGVAEHVRADERCELYVVVAYYVGHAHLGESVEKALAIDQDLAEVAAAELEEVAQDHKLAILGFNVVEESVEKLLSVVNRKVVPATVVTHVKVTYNENRPLDGYRYFLPYQISRSIRQKRHRQEACL